MEYKLPKDKLALLVTRRNASGAFIRDDFLIVDKMEAVMLKLEHKDDVYDLTNLIEEDE